MVAYYNDIKAVLLKWLRQTHRTDVEMYRYSRNRELQNSSDDGTLSFARLLARLITLPKKKQKTSFWIELNFQNGSNFNANIVVGKAFKVHFSGWNKLKCDSFCVFV